MPPTQIANARDVCQDGTGTIGTNNRMEYEEVEEDHSGGKLYLNVDNPAQCNGTITHWEYCYYKPDEQGVYQVHFAVYRQKIVPGNGNVHYRRQSPSFSISVNLDEEVTVPDFVCTSYYKYVTIQQGDFVGICLPQSNSLDVVSDTSDVADRLQYSDCDDDAPGNIANTNNLSEARDRIAHLYAHISCKFK